MIRTPTRCITIRSPGDHIGWHYDTSYYDGRRYTLLLGVIDESSCRLDYELHTRKPEMPDVPGSVQIPPGGLVFFDGDKLRHRITPARPNEIRVSLTFEYVTEPEHASVAAFHLEHEGRDRVLRLRPGVPPQGQEERRGMSRAADPAVDRRGVVHRAAGWQGFGSVASALLAAGWGLVAVAAFHVVPLVLERWPIDHVSPAA